MWPLTIRHRTLQELLAPRQVLFYGASGDARPFISTREGLARQIADPRCTGINSKYLQGAGSIQGASIAQRMSWAANRETTELEDRAYSLLGIFGVNMSLIYGEGKRAFLRLQLEIIAQSDDDSSLLGATVRAATAT